MIVALETVCSDCEKVEQVQNQLQNIFALQAFYSTLMKK